LIIHFRGSGDNSINKKLIGSDEHGFIILLASLLAFYDQIVRQRKGSVRRLTPGLKEGEEVSLAAMDHPEYIVTWASKVLLNLFFDGKPTLKLIRTLK